MRLQPIYGAGRSGCYPPECKVRWNCQHESKRRESCIKCIMQNPPSHRCNDAPMANHPARSHRPGEIGLTASDPGARSWSRWHVSEPKFQHASRNRPSRSRPANMDTGLGAMTVSSPSQPGPCLGVKNLGLGQGAWDGICREIEAGCEITRSPRINACSHATAISGCILREPIFRPSPWRPAPSLDPSGAGNYISGSMPSTG